HRIREESHPLQRGRAWPSRHPSPQKQPEVAPFDSMLAGLLHGVGAFCDAPIISIAGPRPRKEKSRGTPDSLSHDKGRWALHLLQRGRSEGRADASPAARISLFIADV